MMRQTTTSTFTTSGTSSSNIPIDTHKNKSNTCDRRAASVELDSQVFGSSFDKILEACADLSHPPNVFEELLCIAAGVICTSKRLILIQRQIAQNIFRSKSRSRLNESGNSSEMNWNDGGNDRSSSIINDNNVDEAKKDFHDVLCTLLKSGLQILHRVIEAAESESAHQSTSVQVGKCLLYGAAHQNDLLFQQALFKRVTSTSSLCCEEIDCLRSTFVEELPLDDASMTKLCEGLLNAFSLVRVLDRQTGYFDPGQIYRLASNAAIQRREIRFILREMARQQPEEISFTSLPHADRVILGAF